MTLSSLIKSYSSGHFSKRSNFFDTGFAPVVDLRIPLLCLYSSLIASCIVWSSLVVFWNGERLLTIFHRLTLSPLTILNLTQIFLTLRKISACEKILRQKSVCSISKVFTISRWNHSNCTNFLRVSLLRISCDPYTKLAEQEAEKLKKTPHWHLNQMSK